MRIRSLPLLAFALAAAACPTEPPPATDDPAPLVFIDPAAPTTVDALVLRIEPAADAGFTPANWVINWQQDGARFSEADGADAVPATATARDEAWSVTLTSTQTGETATSAVAVIGNSAPSMSYANLDPAEPRSDEAITVLVGGWADADQDPADYSYRWLVDGDDVGAPDSDTLSTGWCAAGEQVSVVVTPTDGIDEGEPITAAAVLVANGAPLPPSISILPAEATDADDLVCVVTESFDPDDDPTTVSITWAVAGNAYPLGVPGAIGPTTTTITGDTVPAQDTAATQNWVCTAIANDGSYDSEPSTASVYLSAGPVSDFSLEDVNATSPRFGQAVSPRDYLQKVSGWYFGHAT